MTRVRISQADLLDDLIDHLQQRPDVIVSATNRDTIDVSLLGSYNAAAMKLALDLRLRAWQAAERARGRDVELEFS